MKIKLKKVFKHIRNRTLKDRIMLDVRPRIRNQKAKIWNQRSHRHSEMVMRIFPGVRIALYSDCILSRAIYMDRFEWQELKFMSEFLSPGDTFLDIGSNFGLYSLVAAKIVGSRGTGDCIRASG